ncbi:MAG: hypothetical protein WCG25_02960 [bacterium]
MFIANHTSLNNLSVSAKYLSNTTSLIVLNSNIEIILIVACSFIFFSKERVHSC